MKRTYIKCEIWHLLGALASQLLVSAAGTVGWAVLKGLGKKIWGEGKKDLEEDKG